MYIDPFWFGIGIGVFATIVLEVVALTVWYVKTENKIKKK